MSSYPPPTNDTAQNITKLYQQVVIDPKKDVSSAEKKFDKFVDRITTKPESPSLDFVNTFYAANQVVIQTAAKGLVSNLDIKYIDATINNFQEASKIVMKGLDALGQAHPFISVAVIAFKLVVSLDWTRRENNKKVLVLRVQMQDMMCVLFQLRHFKDPKEVAPDGSTLQDRFQGLMNEIADDIKNCGSACDVYMKKGVIARTIKSKIYEDRLADWGNKFIAGKKKIQEKLSVHTALGVDRANEKLDQHQEVLEAINKKLDMIMLFRKLDSLKEQDMNKFIENNGGAKAVIEDQSKLEELISKSGESMESLGGDSRKASDIASIQKSLMKELMENVTALFEKNMALFGGKLNILQSNMKQESAFIIQTLSSGSHDRIRDADLRAIWKEMGWKGSIKARHFVLMLKDYFSDKEGFISKRASSSSGLPNASPVTPMPDEYQITPTTPEEEWALRYITIANLQPISEAVDDDATGFINISEVNVFAEDRPPHWSLLKWLAFWAAGYHLNVTGYRTRIYSLLGSMHHLLHQVKPANRRYADIVLDTVDMRRLELVLRGTRPYPDPKYSDSALGKLADEYWNHELSRLEENLRSVRYELDDPATVTLVTGAGRIEKHFWPLVYLILRRLHRIFKLACQHVLSWAEFEFAMGALSSIFSVIDDRVDTLRATFQHANLDADAQLSNFAFGMYRYHASTHQMDARGGYPISENSIWREYIAMSRLFDDKQDEDLTQWLNYPIEDEFQLGDNAYAAQHVANANQSVEGMKPSLFEKLRGPWSGHFLVTIDGKSVSISGVLDLRLEFSKPSPPVNLEGETDPEPEILGNDAQVKGDVEPGDATSNEEGDGHGSEPDGEDEEDEERTEGSKSSKENKAADDGRPSPESLKVYGVLEGMSGLGEATGWYTPDAASDGTFLWTVTLPGFIPVKVELTVSNLSDNMSGQWHNPNLPDDYAYDSGDEDEDVLQTRGTVIFSRAPALVYCHRPRPEEFAVNRIKALWSYAKAAVRDEVRYRLSPWKYVIDRVLEANDFIKLQFRELVDASQATPTQPLTPEELSRLEEYQYRMHPTTARYFNGMAEADVSRLPSSGGLVVRPSLSFHFYIRRPYCDWCKLAINVQHSLCITCLAPDWMDTIDLCPSCVDKCPSRGDLVHKSSHTVFRTYGFMHNCEYPKYIPKARQVAKRIKVAFREKSSKKSAPQPSAENMQCHYCKQAVKFPCWVCLDCENDTYVCKSCDIKQAKLHLPSPSHLHSSVLAKVPPPVEQPVSSHSFEHTMIRVGDAIEEEPKPDALVVIKETMDRRLHKLEDRVDAIDARLAMFETMLTKIFTHITGAPPQPEMLTIPTAKHYSKESPIERSRSRAGRRKSIQGSESGFNPERD